MSKPMPDYMKTPEWDVYKGDDFSFELKEGAPEWLKIAVAKDFEPDKERLIERGHGKIFDCLPKER
jgi:hypothetical protein